MALFLTVSNLEVVVPPKFCTADVQVPVILHDIFFLASVTIYTRGSICLEDGITIRDSEDSGQFKLHCNRTLSKTCYISDLSFTLLLMRCHVTPNRVTGDK